MARKRNAGEGSIFQRADGRWCAQLDLGWQGGRRARKYIYGATAGEVQDVLLKARGDHVAGLPVAVERQTVGQFLADWLESSVKPSVRAATYVSYEHTVRNHLSPELGRLPLRKLGPQHIRAMLNRKLAQGELSARSVAYLRVVLRAALNQACKWSLVARNAAELAEPPKCERFRIEPLSPEQARALLDATKGARLEALYVVALACGLRMGEVLGLRWQDVDLDRAQLTVAGTLQRQKGRGLVLVETKTARSRRMISLPAPLIAGLKTHRIHQLEERLAAGPRWCDSGLVFVSGVGTPLEPRNLFRAFKATLVRAGLPEIRFHDLRHSAASLMLAQGVPLRVVMEVLGHSSIALTANTYSHVMPSLVRDATEKMADVLFGAGR
jgi:integrase